MKNKKDILFLCQFFYPEYVSSATLPYDTAVAIAEAGFSVDALCGYPKEYSIGHSIPKEEINKNIHIRRLKYIQLKRSSFIGRLINYFSFSLSVILKIGILKKYKVVIVYSNPPILPIIATIANKLFNTKVVFVCYDVYPEIALATNTISKSGVINRIMKFGNKIIFKNVKRVVVLSDKMKNFLEKNRLQLSNDRINVIPNWYEDKPYTIKENSSSIVKEIKGKDDFLVSYFGNMGTCQDISTIVNAMRSLKDKKEIKFLFAGHGNKMDELKKIVENERLENVKIFNFLHGDQFDEALRISDCFIVSLAEGLTGLCVPSKIYSYMMAGSPIIAIMDKDSDIVGELKEYNCGYSMQVGEDLKLVNAIETLYFNTDKRKLMGKNCRKVFLEKYTKEICTQKYVDMMKEILEG